MSVLFLLVMKEERTEDRCQGQGQAQGAEDGEGIGVGHRSEERPSGPVIEKSGMNAQMMIVVEKNSAFSISCEASVIRSIKRPRPVGARAR